MISLSLLSVRDEGSGGGQPYLRNRVPVGCGRNPYVRMADKQTTGEDDRTEPPEPRIKPSPSGLSNLVIDPSRSANDADFEPRGEEDGQTRRFFIGTVCRW